MRDYANRTLHRPVDLQDTVVEAMHRALPLAHGRGVTFLASLAQTSNGDGAAAVLGDPVLLEEMVEHLVSFSLRFAPDGGCVEVDVRVRGEWTVLYVRDRGPVVAAERLELAPEFDVLPGEPRSAGWRLDYSIATRLVKFHRGTTTLRNRVDGGCECEVRLPRRLPARFAAARSVRTTNGVDPRWTGHESRPRTVSMRRF
jgi:signal transduction histidine kinase